MAGGGWANFAGLVAKYEMHHVGIAAGEDRRKWLLLQSFNMSALQLKDMWGMCLNEFECSM